MKQRLEHSLAVCHEKLFVEKKLGGVPVHIRLQSERSFGVRAEPF